jgi:hypothetical protein
MSKDSLGVNYFKQDLPSELPYEWVPFLPINHIHITLDLKHSNTRIGVASRITYETIRACHHIFESTPIFYY